MLFLGIGKRYSQITIEFYQTSTMFQVPVSNWSLIGASKSFEASYFEAAIIALLTNLFDHCENGIDYDLGPVLVNEVFAIPNDDVAAIG